MTSDRVRVRGFTIIELLVVVSIIALLVGILLPAIGKARQSAMLTQSISNIRQVGTTLMTYSAEYNDKHVTFCVDNLGAYGEDGPSAFANYAAVSGSEHPQMYLGLGQTEIWYYGPPNLVNVPIDFDSGFGAFRIPNAMILSDYMNGKFYDPVYYAPKDSAVQSSIESALDLPMGFPGDDGPENLLCSSYCLSPAAMFSPSVFGRRADGKYFTDPYHMDGGFKSPTLSQAEYPDLKTWVIEHHWLQNKRTDCNPHFQGEGTYDGCEPYYFNHSVLSNPATLFFDGHISTVGTQNAVQSNQRVFTQTANQSQHGLWSIDTPLHGGYAELSQGGYFMGQGFDWTSTSFHILTIDGIKGRDVTAGSGS